MFFVVMGQKIDTVEYHNIIVDDISILIFSLLSCRSAADITMCYMFVTLNHKSIALSDRNTYGIVINTSSLYKSYWHLKSQLY